MHLYRLLKILGVLIIHRIDRLLPAGFAPVWLRILLSPLKLIPANDTPEVALRLALEELGPVFIKFGQILSTRKDLFEPDLAEELEKLQDRVPPFPSEAAAEIIERNLGRPIAEVFSEFEVEPLASASVAQVHVGTLHTGEDVAVKVIRPGIEKIISRDIRLMRLVARIIVKLWRDGKRLHPVEIVDDYEVTILNELNLSLEASNTARLRDNWLDSGKLYVPKIYWPYCTQDVMVMERIYGVTASDITTLKAANTDLRKLAHLGVEIFFTQVFEHNFFHADMHPGNVFIDITDPRNPSYIALDCAIIGSLGDDDKNYLARNLLAFFRQDYAQVAHLHIASGWVPADTNPAEFEAVIRSVCEPIFQKPIKEISFGNLLLTLFQTARQFEMEVQPQLVLLQKTLLNIEGMGRQIYDDLDLWETAAPFMERWMDERVGVRHILKSLSENVPGWLARLPEIPDLAYTALNEMKQMGAHNRQQTKLLDQLRVEIAEQNRRSRFQKAGGYALIAALLSMLLPFSGIAQGNELLLGTSILGSVGIYLTLVHG